MTIDFRKIRFVLADFVAAYLSWVAFFLLRKKVLDEGNVNSEEYLKLFLGAGAIAGFWILLYYLFGFYHDIYRKSRIKEFLNLMHASFWGCIFVFLTTLLDDIGVNDYHKYYKTLLLYFSLHFGLGAVMKFISISHLKYLIKNGIVSFNCLLVGNSEKVLASASELKNANHILGLKFIGFVSSSENPDTVKESEVRYWGDTNNILKVIRRCHVDRVVICINPTEHLKIKEITNLLAGSGTKVSVMPDLYQILIGSVKVEHVLGVPLIDIDHDLMPFWQTVLKRWLDIAVAATVMLVGLPFFLIFMFVTRFTSKGPIFFVQERVGLNGKLFNMVKFRSMYTDAEQEGPALATEDDPRITSWGKFMRKTRIDELPQFWHVFVGDMSLVGPRPERQFFIDQITQYAPEYRHLHKIRPGITSLGQVKYGYAENIDQMLERLKYDLLYIENMSIANDFRILYFTIMTVIEGKGSNMEFDVIIAGGGIVGLATALKIKEKNTNLKVALIEKETSVAKHQTGNNSGVIHSGIYYKPGSLKVTNCINGYHLLLDFCNQNGIKYNLCGKVIVATEEWELPILENIYQRGLANGLTNCKKIKAKELKEYEPHVDGIEAIHVPQTGIIDYKEVSQKMAELFQQKEGTLLLGEKVTDIRPITNGNLVETSKGNHQSKLFVNCGGLYCDKIAGMQDPNLDVRIIPFRGEYYEIKPEKQYLVKTLVYPVPDPNFPFLGVHFTNMVHGGVEAGPNAVFAFGKESYKKTDINVSETFESLAWPGFRKVAAKYWKTGMGEYYRSFSKAAFTKALQKLVPEIQEDDLVPGGAGIRAQACHRDGTLLDDFCIKETGNSIHVLNAPSPAATSSLSIGETISSMALARF